MTKTFLAGAGLLTLIAAGALAAMESSGHHRLQAAEAATPIPAPAGYRAAPAERQVYFGELHLHTTMSFDAWTFGTKTTPDQAYKFARGEQVMVSPTQLATEQGRTSDVPVPAQRAWPLDFAAVTDHSEYLGAVSQLDNPTSPFSLSKIGQMLKSGGRAAFFLAGQTMRGGQNDATKDFAAAAVAADGWTIEKRAANENYRPGKFTTLIGYEWTSSPGTGVHTHRNVFFSGDDAPAPFSAIDSNDPRDLWAFMASVRARGQDVLAIPHNSNLSDGVDFSYKTWKGEPVDAIYARAQALNEPLVEISQVKGTSETTPQLSPNDEYAGFEIMDRVYAGQTKPTQHGSYVREGLGRGLEIKAKVGVNPFHMGFVGAGDIHNGLSVSDENQTATGTYGLDTRTMDLTGDPLRRALGLTDDAKTIRPNGQRENDPLQGSSAAITGVWAERNDRPSIFAALRRKETFATSGTRIRVRMFGGWTFTKTSLSRKDWVSRAYAEGVPMGQDLPGRPSGASAPRFLIQAAKDPTGASLDRVQVVKVWLGPDGAHERVYNALTSAGAKGSATLSGTWTDPDFNPSQPGLYYARVLELPTPRWSTLLATRNHMAIPTGPTPMIQERAWGSPIWFTPQVKRN